jgi:glycosyltransferase involved in cell wall biosynthesis
VRQEPEEFEAARDRLGERVIHFGRADRATYARLLWQADVVVSTAIHEFFGVAVVEAIYCGTFPVLPRRLAYPELLPANHHHRCLYDDFEGLMARLRWALEHPKAARRVSADLREVVASFDWGQMAPRYDAEMERVVREAQRGS